MASTRIIESGKYKGRTLQQCPKEYLVWASKHEKNFAKRNQWISRDARFALLMLEREAESQAAQAALREEQVWDSTLQAWVTPSADDALDVEKHSKWGYAIERQAKNREKALISNEMRQVRARRTDISTKGSLYKPFSLMR